MSLEAALEEERLEILKLLERPQQAQRRTSPHPSGAYSQPSSPRAHYSTPLARARSPARQVSSLIDAISQLPIPSSPHAHTGPASGTASPGSITSIPGSPPSGMGNGLYRTRSDASNPRLLGRDHRNTVSGLTPNEQYNFSMIPSVAGTSLPGRKRQGSGSQPKSPGAAAYGTPRSPMISSAMRSSSPHVGSPPLVENGNKIMTENGEMIDLDTAYARLTDDALMRSGGMLQSLPERRPVVDAQGVYVRAGTGESITRDGGLRLQKDIDPNDEHAIVDSSDPDDTSDEDSGSPGSDEEERGRGRSGVRTTSLIEESEAPRTGSTDSRRSASMLDLGADPGGGRKSPKNGKDKGTQPKRKTLSLLAAAEEERKTVSSKYKVRSLLPSISVTPSSMPGSTSPTTARRSGVHPSTSFDVPSAASTPVSSDQEADDIDIRRAQRMETSISPIMSYPDSQRVVRTILRGDYEGVKASSSRRARKYLVATDLSSEAQYAMEWTIGTVLRDGDTLMAIYAVDQDTVEDGAKTVSESSIGDALLEVSSQAQAAATAGTLTPPVHHQHLPGTSSPLAVAAGSNAAPEQSRERTKAERERYVAAEAITGAITKLLKKTRLQTKVIIEVIHCKSPKHLLTEMIDLCEPTLVVLGSRGRSALKGVLLGSFSNYLVAKSSVPVMVARKKLKHTKKYAQTRVRLSNNLTSNSQRILANAKVD